MQQFIDCHELYFSIWIYYIEMIQIYFFDLLDFFPFLIFFFTSVFFSCRGSFSLNLLLVSLPTARGADKTFMLER